MSEEICTLSDEGYLIVTALVEANNAIAAWKETREKLVAELRGVVGPNARTAQWRGHNVLAAVHSRPRPFDVKAFAADHPSLYEQYRKEPDGDIITLRPAKDLPNPAEVAR